MLRRLDSIYRSPVYSIVCECIVNSICLRSLGAQTLYYFENKLKSALDESIQVSFNMSLASQWLSMRLQIMGCIVTCAISLLAVFATIYKFLPINASLVGLSLSYSIAIVNNLSGLVSALAETEQEMVSMERLRHYMNLQTEDELLGYDVSNNDYDHDNNSNNKLNKKNSNITSYVSHSRNNNNNNNNNNNASNSENHLYTPLLSSTTDNLNDIEAVNFNHLSEEQNQNFSHVSNWLTHGQIVFSHVSFRYEMSKPYALHDLNLTITAGSKVCILGRTGSGKSSLFRVLLRMAKYEGMISIDHTDIASKTANELRRNIG